MSLQAHLSICVALLSRPVPENRATMENNDTRNDCKVILVKRSIGVRAIRHACELLNPLRWFTVPRFTVYVLMFMYSVLRTQAVVPSFNFNKRSELCLQCACRHTSPQVIKVSASVSHEARRKTHVALFLCEMRA